MATVTYEKPITALIVVDPYNDFISEGGKIWDRIRRTQLVDAIPRHRRGTCYLGGTLAQLQKQLIDWPHKYARCILVRVTRRRADYNLAKYLDEG